MTPVKLAHDHILHPSDVASRIGQLSGIFSSGELEQSYLPAIRNETYVDLVYAPFSDGRSGMTMMDAGANVGLKK